MRLDRAAEVMWFLLAVMVMLVIGMLAVIVNALLSMRDDQRWM